MSLHPHEPYSVAKGYVQSAYAMMANPHRLQLPDDRTFFMAFHMLCGFAVELYLKAFLAHKGYSERQLKHLSVGHDLIKLRDLCISEGLYASASDFLVSVLGKHHKSFEYRYMKSATEYQVTDLRGIFSAFSSLDRLIDSAIGASYARGKQPNGKWDFPTDGAWRFPEPKTTGDS
jgi:hypothetical protein